MSNPAYQAARARKSRMAIVEAALPLFAGHGFATVKLKDIAAAANVSTATLFKHFPQKESLLQAAIDTLAALEDDSGETPAGLPVADTLGRIGLSYARRLEHPMTIGLIRLGIAEAERVPDVGQAVLDAWRWPFIRRLEGLLDRAEGLIVPDRSVAARQFLGLITDTLLWPRLMGAGTATDAGYRQTVVSEAVKTFLARYESDY